MVHKVEATTNNPFFDLATKILESLDHHEIPHDRARLRHQLEGLKNSKPPEIVQPTPLIVVRDQDSLVILAKALLEEKAVAIDFETEGTDPRVGDVVGVGLATASHKYYIPCGHKFEDERLLPDQIPFARVFSTLSFDHFQLVAHNAKFELSWILEKTKARPTFAWDTMLAAKCLNPDKKADLKTLAKKYCNASDWALEKDELAAIQYLPVQTVAEYCANDCEYTLKLYQRQTQQLEGKKLLELLTHVEFPLVEVVTTMEANGYLLDQEHLRELRQKLDRSLTAIDSNIRDTNLPDQENGATTTLVESFPDFNLKSSTQVGDLLFNQLGLPGNKKTEKGQFSTNEEVLSTLVDHHPVVQQILDYRKISKLIGTYGAALEKADEDGRLRNSFKQLGAQTGRFTCKGIFQTIPKEDTFNIRSSFCVPDGYTLISADFSQQELRILAGVTHDPQLLEAIDQGIDLHSLAAVKVFNLPCTPAKVKTQFKEKRDQVKAIQFGLIYGRGTASLASELGITKSDAKQLVEDYFNQFPFVKQYIENVHELVLKQGWIEDLFGRKRFFPDAKLLGNNKENYSKRQTALRQAQNFMIQGPAATITKKAMLNCFRFIKSEMPEIKIILTLHDELQFEVPNQLVSEFTQRLPVLMCDLDLNIHGLNVPMEIEVKTGKNWGNLQPLSEQGTRNA